MVKNIAMAAALVASLMVADQAFARGHRGCKSCGGCSGGVCYVPAGSEKQAYTTNAPPGVAPTSANTAPVVASAPAAPTYYANTARRGLFGRR